MTQLSNFFLILSAVFTYNSFSFAAEFENPFLKFNNVTLSKTTTLHESGQIIVAPAGNGQIKQIPEFPLYTQIRLGLSLNGIAASAEGRTDIALKMGPEKISKIMQALDKEGLLQEAVRLSKIFKIHPLHILGPIIGENTFNGFIDQTIQNTYHNLFRQSDIDKMSEKMSKITNNTEAQNCLHSDISNYWKWRCVIFYSVNSVNNSNRDLIAGFYSKSGPKSGTFGLGQIQPFLLWSLNDIVSQKTNYEKFEINNLDKPMHIIFNNKEMLAYIAANAILSIQVYKLIAGVDISQNPGLTTSLYNLGDEYSRAYNLNLMRRQHPESLPQVNYMGWYVNTFDTMINSYLSKYK